MKIYIPTSGRPHVQVTADMLKRAGANYVLVVPPEEEQAHHHPVVTCIKNRIATKRTWILHNADDDKCVMMDDDLSFYARNHNNSWDDATTGDVIAMLKALDAALDAFAHGGVSCRAFGHSKPRGFVFNKRYIHVLAYNRALFPRPLPVFRTVTGQDHDMNLQLLLSGRASFTLTDWSQDDKPNAAGGCSVYRTHDVYIEGCKHLVKLFPGIVRFDPTPQDPHHMKINWSLAAKRGGCFIEHRATMPRAIK